MVAVVVPSPATSEVFDATSRTICAPMFSSGSFRSISLATVTPSLVIVVAGANPMELKRGIEKAVEVVVESIKKLKRDVKGNMIAQVGTISANGDETIGKIIAEAMEKVGKDGVITVEEAKTLETTLDVVEGMQFDRGSLAPSFVTDRERMEVVLETPVVLIHEKKISSMKALLPVLEDHFHPL